MRREQAAVSAARAAGLFLLAAAPLLRGGWELWSQALVSAVWAAAALAAAPAFLRRPPDPFPAVAAAPSLAVFLAASAASALVSSFPHSALRSLHVDAAAPFFFFFAAAGGAEHGRACRRALLAGGAAAGVLALVRDAPASIALAGPLPNPNALAACLLLLIPLAWKETSIHRAGPGLWLWRLAAAALVGVLLGTRSFLAYFVVLGQGYFWIRAKNKRAAGLAALAVLAVAGAWFFRADWVRLVQWEADRPAWWRTALAMWLDNPFLGAGPGAFGEAYAGYRAVELGQNSLYAHNFFLDMLAERGLLGMGAFLLFLTALVRRLRAAPGLDGAAVLGVAGFLAYNLAHIGFSFPGVYWIFWAAAGLAWSETRRPAGAALPLKARRWILAAGLVLAAAAAFNALRLFRADQCLARARAALRQGDVPRAKTLISTGLRWNAREPELHSLDAAVVAASGNFAEALARVHRAAALSPFTARFREEAGDLSVVLGRRAEALEHYRRASRLLPLRRELRSKMESVREAPP
ncbi:MAG: O-antigen ligase family protein [Elusimicrobiota bacterium]